MKTYYKVVCNCCYGIQSVTNNNDCTLFYRVNEWKFPKIKDSKLFVFDNLEDANNTYYGTEIWECKVINPSKIKKIACPEGENIELFWKYRKNKKKIFPWLCKTMFAPKGTIICDAIKLIRKVKNKQL